MSNRAEDNGFAHGGHYMPTRGPHHYARTMHLRQVFKRHHMHRQALRFHRWGFVAGLAMMAMGSGPEVTHSWGAVGLVVALGCGARALFAFGALPVGDRRRT